MMETMKYCVSPLLVSRVRYEVNSLRRLLVSNDGNTCGMKKILSNRCYFRRFFACFASLPWCLFVFVSLCDSCRQTALDMSLMAIMCVIVVVYVCVSVCYVVYLLVSYTMFEFVQVEVNDN